MSIETVEPATTFVDVVNRHDDAAFLDLLTADAVVDDWGTIYRGTAAISGWNDREFVGSAPTFTPTSCTSNVDGTLTVVGDWRSQHANGPSTFVLASTDGKISALTISAG